MPESLTREPWEEAAVARLCELLSVYKLRDLLGELESALRTYRRETSGKDKPSTKVQLASALVIQHGKDLLAVPEIRKVVAKAAKIPYLGRWFPGKEGAWNFTEATGFPGEFAGQAADRPPDDEIDLEPPPELPKLQDFQKEVQAKAQKILKQSAGKAIISLPTGAGKTRVAVETLRGYLKTKRRPTVVLWLAQSEELCEQAVESFTDVWRGGRGAPPIRLTRLWGSYSKDRRHRLPPDHYRQRPNIVISTPQRYLNELELGSQRGGGGAHPVAAKLAKYTRVVVIDEAHRGAAPTYRQLLEALRTKSPKVSLLGLTATPFRMEYNEEAPTKGTEELKKIFGELIVPERSLGTKVRVSLQERGILAEPKVALIKTGIRLPSIRMGRVKPSAESLFSLDEELRSAANQPKRRRAVFRTLLPVAQNPKASILYFGPRVIDAASIAYLLRSEGIPAAFLSGETKRATRRQIISDFREGRIRVLCNCEVLTTGFDAPRVSHVFVARPTLSGVLYQQMVGRGLRGPQFGGTESCEIYDCEDGFVGSRRGFQLGFEEFREVWGLQ